MRKAIERVCCSIVKARVQTRSRIHTAIVTHLICEAPSFARN